MLETEEPQQEETIDWRLNIDPLDFINEKDEIIKILGKISEGSILFKFIDFVNKIGLEGQEVISLTSTQDLLNNEKILIFRCRKIK